MTRKITKLGANRAGTGTVANKTSEKWTDSVAAQVATAAQIKGIMTKTIPIAYVITDPENPRKLDISQTQITAIASKYPIDKSLLTSSEPSDWIDDYVQRVAEEEQLVGKAFGDFESLVSFAAALKSADRLLHPIVVWKDESTFHVIAGERRLLAHILLGESHIAARIAESNYDRDTIDSLQWEENIHRVDMNLWERVERVKKILSAGDGIEKTSVTKLSKLIGRSRAECQRYLAILRYPHKLLIESIKNGKINDLKKAASLAQLSIEELNQFLTGSSTKAIKPTVTFNQKEKVPAFGLLIKAAARQLKLQHLVANLDLNSQEGINEALANLLSEMGPTNHG